MKKTKKGAASFYVVAFSTLILLIIVTSFSVLVISQITRSMNDELAQSAYDSALAGVEDAKLAFYNYRSCLAQGANGLISDPNTSDGISCDEIVWLMENYQGCDKVAFILGRKVYTGDESDGGEVLIKETNNSDNNMQQYYTCVKLQTTLNDYRSTLSSENQMKVIQVRTTDDETYVQKIKRMVIRWGTNVGSRTWSSGNTSNLFPAKAVNPPVLSVAVLQGQADFKMKDFYSSMSDGRTNSGIVYLVPMDSAATASTSNGNYIGSYNGATNNITKVAFAKSNDKLVENLPYGVYCDKNQMQKGDEFACSATIELPDPIGEPDENGQIVRGPNNLVLAIGLPYGGEAADFALEFYCDERCGIGGESDNTDEKQVTLKGMQISIDSTGRANDLFRRVEARLEGADDYALSLMGPLELFGGSNNSYGGGSGTAMKKEYSVTCEATEAFRDPNIPAQDCR